MRLPTILTAAWVGLVTSQCFSSIPQCAQSCLTSASTQTTSCGDTDWFCQCASSNHQAILQSAENCVDAACGQAQWLESVRPAADAFCNAVNGGETCSTPTDGGTSTTFTSTTTTLPGSTPSTSSGTPITSGSTSLSAGATSTTSGGSSPTGTSTAGAVAAGPVNSLGMMILGILAVL